MEEAEPSLEEIEAEIKAIEDAMGPEERAQYEDMKSKLNTADIPWGSPYDNVRPWLIAPCTSSALLLSLLVVSKHRGT